MEIIDHYDHILISENETKALREQIKKLNERLTTSLDIIGNLIKRWN